VIFGKTHSPEFGLTTSTETALFGQTANPWDLSRTSGGSSGGASSAVAGGIVPAANASDGGGSIRVPASCCGLVGLKPTRARNPAGPAVGEGWGGMSTAHAVSRSVRDTAALLDATHGPDLGDPYCAPAPARPYLEEVGAPPGRLRVAVQRAAFNGVATHPDCVAAVDAAVGLLEELGHEVVESQLEVDAGSLGNATRTIISANIRATVQDRARALGREAKPDDVELGTWAMVQLAESFGADDYARAVRTIHAVGRQVARFLDDFDVLLSPTMATPPLELGRLSLSRMDDVSGYVADLNQTIGYTSLFNASGNPALVRSDGPASLGSVVPGEQPLEVRDHAGGRPLGLVDAARLDQAAGSGRGLGRQLGDDRVDDAGVNADRQQRTAHFGSAHHAGPHRPRRADSTLRPSAAGPARRVRTQRDRHLLPARRGGGHARHRRQVPHGSPGGVAADAEPGDLVGLERPNQVAVCSSDARTW